MLCMYRVASRWLTRQANAVAQRFVKEARLSGRRFDDATAEADALIYKYSPVGSADGGSYQAYFFSAGSSK